MIKTLDGLSFLTGKPYPVVHEAWKLARRTATADLQRGNYVLTFKTMCMILKVRYTHLPELIGDRVFLLNELLEVTAATPESVTLADQNGVPRVLPLLNLILCERRRPNIPGTKTAP